MVEKKTLLILEDGDEYLRFFSRHVANYDYIQAHSHAECLQILEEAPSEPYGIVLDLRFDRIPREELIGDVEEIAEEMFGGPDEMESAWRYIIDNQGYLILRELREDGFEQPALIVAEIPPRHASNLKRLYGNIGVVPSFDASTIQRELARLLGV